MNKIIGFFGGDSQVGTTMLAQSFAEVMGRRGKQVLLILGSGKFGAEFAGLGNRRSLDDLKAAVRSGRVEAADLQQAIETVCGISILPPVRNPLTAKYFPENTYEVLLAEICAQYDYVVIDGGDDANLGLMVSALNICDKRFFVTTQQTKSLHRFLLFQKNILEPLGAEGMLIVNKYLREPALFLKRDIVSLTGRKEVMTVPYIEYGWQAEMEGKTLLSFNRFEKAVTAVCDLLTPEEKRGSRWKRRFV